MKIGVVSDTHNNLKNIEIIINLFNDEKVPLVIHTGDIANANSLEKFSKAKIVSGDTPEKGQIARIVKDKTGMKSNQNTQQRKKIGRKI